MGRVKMPVKPSNTHKLGKAHDVVLQEEQFTSDVPAERERSEPGVALGGEASQPRVPRCPQ